MPRGQGPCLVLSADPGHRWSGKAGWLSKPANAPPGPSLRGHAALVAEVPWCPQRPLLSQPPPPLVPFLPEVDAHRAGKEKENSSQGDLQDRRQAPTSRHALPALTGSVPSTRLWEGPWGQGPAGASSARPPGSFELLPWVGQGALGRSGTSASIALWLFPGALAWCVPSAHRRTSYSGCGLLGHRRHLPCLCVLTGDSCHLNACLLAT